MLTNIVSVDQAALKQLLQFNIKRGSNMIAIGPSGVGKCVTGDTLVFTSSGLQPIGDMINPLTTEGLSISCPYEAEVLSCYSGITKTSKWYCDGKNKTIKITTRHGFVIQGTAKHQVIIATDYGPKWKRLDEITTSDHVGIVRKHLPFGKNELPINYAYLLGYFVGDGSFYGQHGAPTGIVYTVGSQDLDTFINKNGKNIKKYFGKYKVYNYENRAPSINIHRNENFTPRALEIKCGRGAANKQVPESILFGTKNVWKHFLMGLFDSDGSAYGHKIEFSSKSKKLAVTVQIMLTAFGIIGSLKEKVVDGKIYYRLLLMGSNCRKYLSEIGFNYDRKQNVIKCKDSKENTNVDIVPVSKNVWKKLKLECKPLPRNFHSLVDRYYRKGGFPSRKRLSAILSELNNLNKGENSHAKKVLHDLSTDFYFWDSVSSIEDGSEEIVYDLVVPDGHSFAANGMMNHNTEMTIQAAEELGYKCGYLNLSVLEAPDLTGLPMIDKDTRITTYASPQFLPLAKGNPDKPIVLMADELDKALPELQNPCLEMFQFRSINSRKLNVHAIVGTGNRPDENAHSNPVSHALTNRCKVYSIEHRFDPWLEWATRNGVNGLITMFLDKNKDFLLKPDDTGDPTAYCHPTPRAWTEAGKDLDKLIKNEADINFQQLVIAGWVGLEASVKFRVWLEHYKDIQPMIDNWLIRGEYPHPESPDQVMVCCVAGLNALADACRATPISKEDEAHKKNNIRRLVEYVCTYLQTISEDFLVGSVRATLNKDMINANGLKNYDSFNALFSKICKAFHDHNIDVKSTG